MKFVRLALLFSFISLFFFLSCKKDSDMKEPVKIDSLNIRFINPFAYADSILMEKILLVYLDDSEKSFNGIFEDKSYGIGFFILKPLDTSGVVNYKSGLLDGIGEGSETDTIIINSRKLLFYCSGSAFIGSRNLEVYQYLFDPPLKEIFKSYTALSEDGSVIQIYSQNLKDKSKDEIKIFFKNQIKSKYIDDIDERRVKIKYE